MFKVAFAAKGQLCALMPYALRMISNGKLSALSSTLSTDQMNGSYLFKETTFSSLF
jgi:hypothetical protein